MRRLVLAFLVLWPTLAWGQQGQLVRLPDCPCYSGSVTCATTPATPCYIAGDYGSNGFPMPNRCRRITVNLTTATGTYTLLVQGKNLPNGEFATFLNGTLTEANAPGLFETTSSFTRTRLAVTACGTNACTGTATVCGEP